MFDKKITQSITDLKKKHGAYALKASFEDEGVTDNDLNDLILLSGGTGLQVYVKIGGCEANRDIEKCLRLGISGIVAPMVESPFAVSKFISSVKSKCELLSIPEPKKFVNLETIDACNRSADILAQHHNELDGIVVGRSDLSRSMGLEKKNVNDSEVINVVRSTLENAKKYKLQTKMGGTVSSESVLAINSLFSDGLLDRFETRAVVFTIEDTQDILGSVKAALDYEQMLLQKRHHFHNAKANFFNERVESIEKRK
tara:strand:+ start:359 stop:1126 length:768 start_codon:yes stop_codon:yes gene_type:complete